MKLTTEEFKLFKQRDPVIFEKFYNLYKKDVYNYILILSNFNNEISNEVFSETIHSALESVPNLQNSKNLKIWLINIARNKYNDYIRKLYKNKKISEKIIKKHNINEDISLNNPDNIILEKNKINTLYLALNNLKPIHKEVILFKYFEQLSHNEIAKKINKSIYASESLLRRALISLKKEMKKFKKYF